MTKNARKTILVTGGAGYIGSHTTLCLFQQGYDVIVYDNLYNSTATVIDRVNHYCSGNIRLIRGDILCRDTLKEVFRNNAIDAVIHFAALKAVGESSQVPLAYYQTNVAGTLNLLDVMQAHNVQQFIFSSSATVYGEDNPIPYKENMPLGRPSSPYGQTKVMIEEVMNALARSAPDFKGVSLRYFNPIGAHEDGIIGESPKGTPNNLLPYITQVAGGLREELTVFGDDYPTRDGTCIRDYVHVMDLAEGHVSALEWQLENSFSGQVEYFNLGTGKGISVKELINAFQNVTGIPIPYRVGPRRDGDLPEFWADSSKAREVLLWSAKRGLTNMLADAWNWQKLCNKAGN